jgi:hypothetical protein
LVTQGQPDGNHFLGHATHPALVQDGSKLSAPRILRLIVTILSTLSKTDHLPDVGKSHHGGMKTFGEYMDLEANMIRNIEQERCGDEQQTETFGRHPDHLPPVVLPSTADLDTYVAMVADEEKIRGLTSKSRQFEDGS